MQQALSGPRSPMRRRLALALPLLGMGVTAAPALAGGHMDAFAVQRASRALMGTQVDIVLQGRDAAALRYAADQAFSEMLRLEALMSRYLPDSVVSRIHHAAGVRPVGVPPEVMAVLRTAKALSAASGGAFDATVGALQAWSFAPGHARVPSAAEIARQLPLVNAHGLVLDETAGTAFLTRRGMAVDLGGVAKLPILDAGMQVLRAQGVEHAMINGGGDVLVRGGWRGRAWRVGLRDPRAPERLLGVVELAGQGVVASSGDYERCFMHEGRRMHHVLDPRTGQPSQGVRGVSLVAADVAAVNGLGTAIMVQGVAAAQALERRAAGVDVLAARSDGRVWMSRGMQATLRPVAA